MVATDTADFTPTPGNFKQACAQVNAFLQKHLPGVTELHADSLQGYRAKGLEFQAGWEFSADFSGQEIILRVLVDQNFPFSQSRIGLAEPHPYSFAHLETGSLLCLDPNISVAWDRPDEALGELLSQSTKLIETSLSPASTDDATRREILAYWDKKSTGEIATSVISPQGPGRMVFKIMINGKLILSDNRSDAKEYLASGGIKLKPTMFGEKIPLVWLRRPPSNTQLPRTIRELVRLLLDEGRSGMELFESYSRSTTKEGLTVLAFSDENGAGFIGLKFPTISFAKSAPETLPFVSHVAKSKLLKRVRIRRNDPEWVFGRDQFGALDSLRSKSVLLIGAGSLGSYVASQLSSTGVGRIELVDPQILLPENTSRHLLGADFVGSHKATSLARTLRRRFPTSETQGAASTWQQWAADPKNKFADFDLVVSTIGDWPSEAHLADTLQHSGIEVATIFAWLEPHATGSQAIFLPSRSPCLFCGFTSDGQPHITITTWPHPTRKQVPLCGGEYQAYGAVALAAHASHVADVAIAGMLGRLNGAQLSLQSHGDPSSEGGDWSDWWKAQLTEGDCAMRRVATALIKDSNCKMCAAT